MPAKIDFSKAVYTETWWRSNRGGNPFPKRGDHRVSIKYDFKFRGNTVSGGRLAFGPTRTFSMLAAVTAQGYEPGMEVTAYYDPSRPSESTLWRGPTFAAISLCLAGLGCVWYGVRMLAATLIGRRAGRNSRWALDSLRFTWPDLAVAPALVIGAIFCLLLVWDL